MPVATLHDGSSINVEVYGDGPTVLLPVNPHPVTGPEADVMRQWGADPALGRSLIDALSDTFRVVAFDYEGHVLAEPKPDTLSPANVAGDLLAVARRARPPGRHAGRSGRADPAPMARVSARRTSAHALAAHHSDVSARALARG